MFLVAAPNKTNSEFSGISSRAEVEIV